MFPILIVLLFLFFTSTFAFNQNLQAEGSEEILQSKIIDNKKYKVNVPPWPTTTIFINLKIQSIFDIDDSNMELSLQLILEQEWTDQRLQFNSSQSVRLSGSEKESKIWTPDLYFINEKTSNIHQLLKPNTFIIVDPDGHILERTRLSLTLSCPMNLANFPLDQQSCLIQMGVYGWTKEQISLEWNNKKSPIVFLNKANEIQSQRFKLTNFSFGNCDDFEKLMESDDGSCLAVKFELKRQFWGYLQTTYIPSTMIMGLSWLMFWLPPNALEARLSLGITTLFTLTAASIGNHEHFLSVPLSNAMDTWTGFCLTFILFAILNVVISHRRYRMNQILSEGQTAGFNKGNKVEKLDKMSRVFFPLTFLIYFGWYVNNYALI